jgi:hypothetical protein
MLIIDGSGGASGRELMREQNTDGDLETRITSSWRETPQIPLEASQ